MEIREEYATVNVADCIGASTPSEFRKEKIGFTLRAESANGYQRFGLDLQRDKQKVRKRSGTEARETGEDVVWCERQYRCRCSCVFFLLL